MTTLRLRRIAAVALLSLSALGGACSDDDNDGNPEVDVPQDVDVDVDQGPDKSGD